MILLYKKSIIGELTDALETKVVVVMPAYNAAQTLKMTYDEVMSQEIVDTVILVDDASNDETSSIARKLPKTRVHVHKKIPGYGANQKTCYKMALEEEQTSSLWFIPIINTHRCWIPAMASMIGNGLLSLCSRGREFPRACGKKRDAVLEIYF